jgi:hypothetical protein
MNPYKSQKTNHQEFSTPKRDRESTDSSPETSKKTCTNESLAITHEMSEITELRAFIERSFVDAKADARKNHQELRKENDSIKVTFQAEIDGINARVTKIESTSSQSSPLIQSLQNEIATLRCQAAYNTNRLEQNDHTNEVVAHCLPSKYADNINELIRIINEKVKCNLSSDVLTSFRPVKSQVNNPTCTYFITFRSKAQKQDFLTTFTSYCNKEIVTVEDIFEEFHGTNQAGRQISFRNSLAKPIKNILDAALGAKRGKKIAHAWERNGIIYMRKHEGSPKVEAVSVYQVERFANS